MQFLPLRCGVSLFPHLKLGGFSLFLQPKGIPIEDDFIREEMAPNLLNRRLVFKPLEAL